MVLLEAFTAFGLGVKSLQIRHGKHEQRKEEGRSKK